ncbi:hypothetical protein [Pseudomonas sp. BGI-2]|uniref:hypothetical protein n=1 Tax=Pseudomonas sp. BGI-2 TaxID=2528211 RepID=UPI001035357A|nr:hypothetical protein [Pseudomonas sp. BGI-2]TBN49153.1 hypothetical protein EYC95_06320 [Pseudomonas sp. BGI-2]
MIDDKDNLSFDDVPVLTDIESIVCRKWYKSPLHFFPKHKERNFGNIVAPYHLKGQMIKCGISDCGKPHLHGYLITTSDKLETNIGKDCGTKHFKTDFAAEMKRHDELYSKRLKIGRILELKTVAPSMLHTITSIQQNYLFLKSLRFKLRGALSATDSSRLDHKIKSRDPGLYRYEARSLAEREAYLETNPEARKSGSVPPKQIKIGEISGFSFLGASHKDEDLFNFISPLKAVIAASGEEIHQWRPGEISKTHAWIGLVPKGVSRLESLIVSGNEFFTQQNIEDLALIGISNDSLSPAIYEIRRIMSMAGRHF